MLFDGIKQCVESGFERNALISLIMEVFISHGFIARDIDGILKMLGEYSLTFRVLDTDELLVEIIGEG